MSVKNSLLFGLVLLNEIISEFRDPGGFVSFGYENLYGFVPDSYKRKNFHQIMHLLKKDQFIKSLSRGEFMLTQEGKGKIEKEIFPLLNFSKKPWDGKWRIVGFDIEEEKRIFRNKTRKLLYQLGFRMLQKSLYISPLPVEEEVEKTLALNKNLVLNAYIFISDKFFLEDRDKFISNVFGISLINEKYKNLILEIKQGFNKREERNYILKEFLELSLKDPFLPKELLPKDFSRDQVWECLSKKDIFKFDKPHNS